MLINSTNLEAANRAIQTELNSINERIPQGVHQLFTSVESKKGTSVDHLVVMLHNAFQEWIGPRSEGGARAYRRNYPIRRWERTIRLPVDEINGDVTGVLNGAIQSLQAREGWYMEEIVIAEMLANPTGYDGVSWLNDSHSNVGTGGTTDNLTTGDLGYVEFRTGVDAIQSTADEAGQHFDFSPTLLVVGPAQREVALQVTGAEKVVGVSDTGELIPKPTASGLDAAAQLPNYLAKQVGVTPVVTPRIRGDEFILLDNQRTKPFFAYTFQPLELTMLNRPEDPNVFNDDEVVYGITGKIVPAPGLWQAAYGSVTA